MIDLSIPEKHHYKYGGSNATRTRKCPAWVQLSDGLPPSPSSFDARLGNLKHSMMERKVRDDIDFPDMRAQGWHYQNVKIDDGVIEDVEAAYKALKMVFEMYDIDQFVVEPLLTVGEDIGCSPDLIGSSADRSTVIVVDYKFGKHVVKAENNDQLLKCLYAGDIDHENAGVTEFYSNVKNFVAIIIQPAAQNIIDRWEFGHRELDDFIDDYHQKINISKSGDRLPPNKGSWCRFCPAKAVCPAFLDLGQEALKLKKINLPNAHQFAEILDVTNQLKEWIPAVEELAKETLGLGEKIPGYFLTRKRHNTVFKSPENAAKRLLKHSSINEQDVFKSVMLTVKQIKSMCEEKGIDFEKEFSDIELDVSNNEYAVAHESSDKKPALPAKLMEIYRTATK